MNFSHKQTVSFVQSTKTRISSVEKRNDTDLKSKGIFVTRTNGIIDLVSLGPINIIDDIKTYFYLRPNSVGQIDYFGTGADLLIDIPHFDLKTNLNRVDKELIPLIKTVYLFKKGEIEKFVELPKRITDSRNLIFSIGEADSLGSRNIYSDTMTQIDQDIISKIVKEIQRI